MKQVQADAIAEAVMKCRNTARDVANPGMGADYRAIVAADTAAFQDVLDLLKAAVK